MAAWLALADISTTKLFREHVNTAELHARVNGLALEALEPPSPEQLEASRELERTVLTMVLSGADAEPVSSPMSVADDDPTIDPDEPELGTVPLRLSLPEDLATFWCQLELLHADAGSPMGSFIAFLVAATLETWRGLQRAPAYGDIYLRDRYRCQSPMCRSRHVTPHHIVFRARGGGDEPWNLLSLCDKCHLSLVHEGHLTVAGFAPGALTWTSRAFHLTSPWANAHHGVWKRPWGRPPDRSRPLRPPPRPLGHVPQPRRPRLRRSAVPRCRFLLTT